MEHACKANIREAVLCILSVAKCINNAAVLCVFNHMKATLNTLYEL
jgi:hypothetical protein